MNRIIKSENSTSISIQIKPPRERKYFHLFVLVFCITGLVLAFNHAVTTDKIFIKLFLLIWSFIWIPFIIKILKSYINWQTVTEFIKIEDETFTFIEQFPFKKVVNKFKKDNIRLSVVENYITEENNLVSIPPKTIEIENNDKYQKLSFGRNLKLKEITFILDNLSKTNINFKNQTLPNETINFNKISSKQFSKSYKKLYNWYFIISLLPSFFYGHSLFKNDYYDYSILKSKGEVTEVVSTFRESWDIDYYSYYFLTKSGDKIERSGKSIDKKHFNEYYKNLKVIYDPSNPNRYMEYPNYLNFSIPLKILFYLILIPLILASMSGSVITFGHKFYQHMKKKYHP